MPDGGGDAGNDAIVGREIMARVRELEVEQPLWSAEERLGRAVRELRDRVKRTGNTISGPVREGLERILAAAPGADDRLNDWDRQFLANIGQRYKRFGVNTQVSEKQVVKLREIWEKITGKGGVKR